MLKNSLLLTLTLLFSACGGGGTSVEPTPLKTLYFIDSPVNGIDYHCGVRSGITKHDTVDNVEKDGVLYCNKGTITFNLGSLILGSIEQYKDKQEIRPQDLMHVSQDSFENEQVLKIALLLQSLDDDEEIEKNINIDEITKNKLTQTSLDDLSLAEVGELVKSVGKIPKDLNEVKKHLIRNSSISYEDAKPTIAPFSEDIATASSYAGFTIGILSINKGKAPLTSLTLEGKDSKDFQINKDGTLILLKTIDKAKTYTFEVKAENIYGIDRETIIINVIKSNKLAKVLIEGLSDSIVKIIELDTDHMGFDRNLLFTEKLSSNANFNTHAEELDDEKFYIFEVTKGTITDGSVKDFKGTLRLISQGSWIKNSNKKIYISPLSEIFYDYLTLYLENFIFLGAPVFGPDIISLIEEFSLVSKILINKDLNNDNTIDGKDILGFNPVSDKSHLYKTLTNKNIYEKITNKLLEGDSSYLNILFESAYLENFNNADIIKIRNSFAYIYDENFFYIYDLINYKKISSISIPKNNIDTIKNLSIIIDNPENNFANLRDSNYKFVSIYLELNKNRIFLTNINGDVIAIDITDYSKPKILMNYQIGIGKHIVGIYDDILFFTEGIPQILQDNITTNNIQALDIKDINNPTIETIPNLPFIKHIREENKKTIGVAINTNDNGENNLTLKQYELNNLRTQNSIKLLSSQNLELGWSIVYKIYFDNNNDMYMLSSPGASLAGYSYSLNDIYKKYNDVGLYPSRGYLYNKNKNNIYISGIADRGIPMLSFLDINYNTATTKKPFVSRRILFEPYKEQSSIYFYDNVFTTNESIIDTNSYILSQEAYYYIHTDDNEKKQRFINMFLPYNSN